MSLKSPEKTIADALLADPDVSAIVGDRMICVSAKGLVQSVDVAGDEGRVLATLDLEDEVLASPAVADGAVYVRTNARLTKLIAR